MTEKGRRYYHELGPINVGILDQGGYTVVKEYGIVDTASRPAWEKILIQFARDFPPREGIADSPGWLGPGGRFFPCRSWEHDTVADLVYRYVYRQIVPNPVREFEKRGWYRVYAHFVAGYDREPTQKQLDTIYDLYLIAADERKRRLGEYLENRSIKMRGESYAES